MPQARATFYCIFLQEFIMNHKSSIFASLIQSKMHLHKQLPPNSTQDNLKRKEKETLHNQFISSSL